MGSVVKIELYAKISSRSDFPEVCARAFFRELFVLIPGSEELFSNPDQQARMFANMLSHLMDAISDPERLDDTLVDLGRRHRQAGVQTLHMKVARPAFLNAVAEGCPALTEDEVGFFGTVYDRMVDAMRYFPDAEENRPPKA